jgi:hypothetical protein
MRSTYAIPALLVALAVWTGCSNVPEEGAPAARVLQADQVTLLAPAAVKGAATDGLHDFTLLVRPARAASHSQTGFNLRAPRGCVAAEVLITADWLGDDRVKPAWGFDFGPGGQEFLQPLQLTFLLQPQDLAGLDPSTLTLLLDREDGTYEVVPSEVYEDLVPNLVLLRAEVEHFSRYLIGTGPPPDEHPNQH